MSLRLQYLITAYLAADTMLALETLASGCDDLNYSFSCMWAMALLDSAVQTRDLSAVNNALAYAVQVMDGSELR